MAEQFDGEITDVKVYTICLTWDEVMCLYLDGEIVDCEEDE